MHIEKILYFIGGIAGFFLLLVFALIGVIYNNLNSKVMENRSMIKSNEEKKVDISYCKNTKEFLGSKIDSVKTDMSKSIDEFKSDVKIAIAEVRKDLKEYHNEVNGKS